jgi:hypothetical protein
MTLWLRWLSIALHTRGYHALARVVRRWKATHAARGRAVRDTMWAGAHRRWGAVGEGIPAMELVTRLRHERMA